jgi:hypothetical protein
MSLICTVIAKWHQMGGHIACMLANLTLKPASQSAQLQKKLHQCQRMGVHALPD